MRVELVVTIRGSERRVRWHDGSLGGDDEIIERLGRVVDDGRVDPTDLLSVVRGIELVTAQQVEITDLDLVEPNRAARAAAPPVASAG